MKKQTPKQSLIDLDEMLNGTPTWDQVVAFFKDGEFHEEHYLVEAIEIYLLTEQQRKLIFDNHMSIEKMLNGRTQPNQTIIGNQIYKEWNDKLGFNHFHVF